MLILMVFSIVIKSNLGIIISVPCFIIGLFTLVFHRQICDKIQLSSPLDRLVVAGQDPSDPDYWKSWEIFLDLKAQYKVKYSLSHLAIISSFFYPSCNLENNLETIQSTPSCPIDQSTSSNQNFPRELCDLIQAYAKMSESELNYIVAPLSINFFYKCATAAEIKSAEARNVLNHLHFV